MILDRIFEEARQDPERLAVLYNGQPLTYGHFAGAIAATAHWLGGQDVVSRAAEAGRVAVLCLSSLLDAWVAGLALRALGVTTLSARAASDIAVLGLDAAFVVTRAAESQAVALETGLPVLALVGAHDGGALAADLSRPRGGHILLTSGTTGVYKKVLIDPASEAIGVPARLAFYSIDRSSVVCVFDFGGWTSAGYNIVGAAWVAGGVGVIDERKPGHLALAAAAAAGAPVTHAIVQPQSLSELLATPEGALRRDDAMRLIVISGALPLTLAQEAQRRLTRRIYTNIGATETGPFALTLVESADDLHWHRIDPARQVQVVGDDHQPLPHGRSGLVRVRIEDHVTGYLGDPDVSRAFFRDGYFYTGDLGVMRADGRLRLQGRVTDVLNVQGDKIAAAPIEEALQEQLGVTAVCVFSIPDGQGAESLHVVMQSEGPIAPAVLTAALQSQLRGYPHAQVHLLPVLPRTAAGKLDRPALKARVLGT